MKRAKITSAIASLKSTNLNDGIGKMKISTDDRVCLMICNPYFGERMELGQPVIEDGKLIERIYMAHGYKTFNLVDASKEAFKDAYRLAMSIKLHDFVVYYSGHGVNVHDSEGSEEDGQDECLVFNDGFVADDYLSSKFEDCPCESIFFIFDCCHSGTLADIAHLKEHNITLDVSSISGCADKECSVQLRNNGIFTYHINEYQNLPLQEIISKTNAKTRRFNQHLQIAGVREKLFKEYESDETLKREIVEEVPVEEVPEETQVEEVPVEEVPESNSETTSDSSKIEMTEPVIETQSSDTSTSDTSALDTSSSEGTE